MLRRHRPIGVIGKSVQLQSFLTLALDRSGWSTACILSLNTQKGIRHPFNEAGFAPEPFLTFGEKKNLLPLPGFEHRTAQPVA